MTRKINLSPFFAFVRQRGSYRCLGISVFFLLVLFPFEQTLAASFDCKQATTEVEKQICSDPEISVLDEKLASTYQKAHEAAADRDAFRREQREWLAIRNACLSPNCLKAEYESRLAELASRKGEEARSEVISGKYVCDIGRDEKDDHKASEHRNLMLEVDNNVVKRFSSSWVFASDHPDLRPGYAATCQIDLKDLEQAVRHTNGIILRLRPGHHQKYQENCELRIRRVQSSLYVSSTGCIYECLTLDFVIDERTGNCRRAK